MLYLSPWWSFDKNYVRPLVQTRVNLFWSDYLKGKTANFKCLLKVNLADVWQYTHM